MKKIYAWIICFCFVFCSSSWATNSDSSTTNLEKKIEQFNPIFAENIIQKIQDKDFNTIEEVLNQWYDSCGITEPLFRVDLLNHLEHSLNVEDLLNQYTFDYFQIYPNRLSKEFMKNLARFTLFPGEFDYIPPYSQFDSVVYNWAETLKQRYDEYSLEYAILKLYTGNDTLFYQHLQNKSLPEENTFQQEYNKRVRNLYNQPDWNMELLFGNWMPTNKLKQLGNHPIIGFTWGLVAHKNAANLYLGLGFQKTKSLYPIYYPDGTTELTKNFEYFTFGVEYLRQFYKVDKHEIWGLIGVSYDNITIQPADEELALEAVDVGNIGAYGGLQYKFFIDPNFYVGFRSQYLLNDFSRSGLLKMPGNVWMNQISLGILINVDKEESLRALHLTPYR